MYSLADPILQQQINAPRVLIIDDDPRIQDAIEAQLYSEGYELLFKSSGVDAIRELDALKPDVILLDLMMPGMNGFDVCSHIKQSNNFRHVPVIMVTALDDVDYLVTGLDTGADEFIAKPVNGAELRARVRSMLRIKHQYDELGQAIQVRDLISRMIVHDMRNPLSSILLYSQVIQRKKTLPEEQILQVAQIQQEALRLGKLFDEMLVLSRLHKGQIVLQPEPADLAAIIMEQDEKQRSIAASSDVELFIQLEDGLPEMQLDVPLIERVVETMVANAIKFAPPKSIVRVLLSQATNHQVTNGQTINGQDHERKAAVPMVCLQIIDEGPLIPTNIVQDTFSSMEDAPTSNAHRPGIELGLAFCQMVVAAHGGTISLVHNSPQGVTFTIELPQSSSSLP